MTTDNLPLTSIRGSDWCFCEGTPAPGWQLQRRDGRSFHLDACINLDTLCKNPPMPNQSEGVLYATISLSKDTNAMLGMGCDWCFEAYCDGHLLKSTYETGNGTDYIFPSNHRIIFFATAGEHLLAIRVRRGQKSWYFACYHCPVIPPPEPELAYGPWLTNPNVGTMTIAFLCKTELGCAVKYRMKGTDEWQTAWHHRQGQCLRRKYHAIPIAKLTPGADYEYQVLAVHPDSFLTVSISPVFTFTVPDATRQNYSFFFTADLQFPLDKQYEILGRMLQAADAASCDFFILGGDVNSAFLPEDVIRGPFAHLCENGAASRPILYLRGNHELRGNFGDQFLDYFASSIGTTYDLLRLGDTAFLMIDSWEDKVAHTPGHTYCQWNLDDLFYQQETDWFNQALKDPRWANAARRIVVCHGAPFSHHASYGSIPLFMQRLTDSVFEGDNPLFSINMWLTGHVHAYMRTIPKTTKIASLEQPDPPMKDGRTYTYPVLTVAGPGRRAYQASCFRIDADPTGFTVRAWNDTGDLIEHIRYDNDGTCHEIVALPYHNAPAK
ncbi:MAG: metallophosphoesterase [Victivallales bacterium]|nr:metallophosphoesterase [Victivallales bacterium]